MTKEMKSKSVLVETNGPMITEAQHEYDNSPELQQLLSDAAKSPTVRRGRYFDKS